MTTQAEFESILDTFEPQIQPSPPILDDFSALPEKKQRQYLRVFVLANAHHGPRMTAAFWTVSQFTDTTTAYELYSELASIPENLTHSIFNNDRMDIPTHSLFYISTYKELLKLIIPE